MNRVERFVEKDPILSLFEFYNDNAAVASASIGQVYKAKIRRGPQLEAAIGKEQAAIWGGKTVAMDTEAQSITFEFDVSTDFCHWGSRFRYHQSVRHICI